MKTTGLVKRLLISSAVLSGLFLVGTSQASADTTNEGATTATSTATTTASNQLTGSTILKTVAPASSTDAVVDEATSSESTTTPTTDTDNTTSTDDTTVPVTDATPDSAVTAASPSSIDATAAPAPTTTTTDTTTEPQSSTKTEASSSALSTKQTPATTTPTVSYKTARDAVVSASVVKADLQLAPEADTIKSGEAATFDLKLAISGIDKTMNQQHVVIDLPDNFKLPADADLTIDGVTPTLNETGTQLMYDFDAPTDGLSISKKYVFDTGDQPIKNGTTLSMAASYFDGEQQLATSGKQTVTITSQAVYGVTNEMIGILKTDADGNVILDDAGNADIDSSKLTGVAGDYLVYQTGISAPKKILGQAYFEPGSTIELTYVLPVGTSLWNVDNATKAQAEYESGTTADGRTVVRFYVTAPSLEDQMAATNNLFTGYFHLVAQINDDLPDLTKLTTQAQVIGTSINNEQVMSDIADSTLTTAANYSSDNIPPDGEIYYEYNWGPADGEGNLELGANRADPQVTPGANLVFLMQTSAADFGWDWDMDFGSHGNKAITKYIATYNVDPHLNVNQMQMYGAASSIRGNDVPLLEDPIADVYVRYQDETAFEETPILSDVTTFNITDMSQYVDNNRGVAQIQFVYTQIPAGLLDNVKFYMSPKAGYYGTVSNDFTVEVAGFVPDGWLDVLFSKDGAIVQSSYDGQPSYHDGQDLHQLDESGNVAPEGSPEDKRNMYNQFMTPQTAEIVKPGEDTPRVLNEALTFANQTNGLTNDGDNVLQVMVENNQASLQSYTGLKSYLVLPKGITYTDDNSQVTATAQTDGSTLLTINWDRTALAPNNQNKLNLKVNIDAALRLDSVTPTLSSTVNETDTVAPNNVDATSDSNVQALADSNDIDGNPATTTVFVLQQTLAVASITNSHQIHVTATATNVAGDTGNLVNAQAGNNASFGISLTPASDGALQNVTITGTMPQTGDTAVLDTTTPRGTTGQVTLNGPIELPATWEHLATVTYALADDPTTYVAADTDTDFSQVVGFQITYAGDSFLNSDAAQQLRIPVTVAKDVQAGQVAYISYAVTANGLATTEGLKAGLALQPSGELGPGIQVKTITKTPEPVFVTPDDYYDYTKPGIPGDGIWVKTQVPEGVFVTPDDYYDNTKTPDNPTGPTTDPTGPTTPVITPSTPVPDDDSTTPSTPANTIGTPTDNDATTNDTTDNDSNSAQAVDNETPSVTTMSQTSNATATMATNDASQATAINATDTTTTKTTNNASATLPQTDEQAPATTSLIGLLLATILGGLGLSRKRRND